MSLTFVEPTIFRGSECSLLFLIGRQEVNFSNIFLFFPIFIVLFLYIERYMDETTVIWRRSPDVLYNSKNNVIEKHRFKGCCETIGYVIGRRLDETLPSGNMDFFSIFFLFETHRLRQCCR